MYCRRSAIDDDRSRKTRLAVDDDRRQGRWAVDDARSRITFYQAQSKKSLDQVDRNLDRIRETLRSIRRMRMSSATIPRHSSSSIPSSASRRRRHTPTVADDYAPLELPLKWRDPPPEYRPLELPLRWRNPPLPPGLNKAKPPWLPTPHPTIADGIRQSSAHRQSRDMISFDPTPDLSIPLQCAPPEAVSEHSSMFSASISSRNPTPHSPSEPVTIPALQLDFALLPTARVDPQLDAGSDSIADINFVEGEWVARHRSTLQHDSGPNNIPLCSGDLASSVEPDLSRADSSSSSHDQPLTALHASITSPPLSLYAHVTDAFHHLTPFLLPDPAASGDEWPHSMSLRAFSQLPSRMTSEPLLTHNWIPRSLNVSVTKTQTQESSQVMPTPGLCSRSVPRPTFLDKSFTGEVPSSLLKFRNLSKLELSNDRFNGSLPENICSTSRLQFLLLGQYFIGGEITHVIQDCMRLFELQLNDNYLTCGILPQIGKIKNLLNLCSNHIQVNLPHELGKLDKMVPLDVSYEKLSGIIPSKSKSMLNLILVNFFNNQLTCPVPIFAPFQKSPLSSLFGNKGLCGGSFESTFDRQLFLEPGKRKLLDIIRGDLKNGIISCACAIEDDDLMMAELLMTELRQVVSVSEEPIQHLGAYLLEGLVARIVSTGSSIYKAFKCKEPTSSELLSFMHILYEVYPCFKFGSEKDEFSWNSMVGALLRTWEIQDAQKLFGEMPKRHIMSWNNLLDEIKSLLCNSSCGKEFIPMVKHVVILHVVISTDGGLQICGNPKELNRLMNKLADRFKRRRIFDPGGLFMLSHAPRTESSSFYARGE